ncbi:MAG: DUF4058 family protein [Gemmataceae bacterium]
MPLHDHFRSPVNDTHHWSELHGGWPMEIVRTLFDLLPPRFHAAPRLYLGSPFEVDVATTEDDRSPKAPSRGGGTATQTASAPTFTVEADLAEQDEYEVLVYDDERERTLVAAVEVISPSNKDRPESRAKFITKVSSLLSQEVCVSLIDPVSIRRANLYADLLTQLGHVDPQLAPTPPPLYAVTLRTRQPPKGKKLPLLDAWFFPLAVGQPLPTIPLWLGPDQCIQLPLEPSYQEVCRLLRIG